MRRTAAGALFRNDAGEIFLVEPVYKPEWEIPGGLGRFWESPLRTARREVREELGLRWRGGRLLVADLRPEVPTDKARWQYVFDGGLFSSADLESISLQAYELASWRFVARTELAEYVAPRMVRRLELALDALERGTTIRALDGEVASDP